MVLEIIIQLMTLNINNRYQLIRILIKLTINFTIKFNNNNFNIIKE